MACLRTSSIYIVVPILLASIVSQCWAIESLSKDEVALGQLQFQGMIDSRKRLSSGVFRGAEKKSSASSRNSQDQHKTQHFFCAFDFPKNWVRFDRDTGIAIAGKQLPSKKNIDIPLQGKYVKRSEYTLRWNTDGLGDVMRGTATTPPPQVVSPFDVRCVGLFFNSVLTGLEMHGLGFDKICEQILSNVHLVKVFHDTNGTCRVVWSIQPPSKDNYDILITTWFNQAYLPIEHEERLRATKKLLSKAETTWQQVSGIWVPRTYIGEDYGSSPNDSSLREKRELVFEWESVNEPVPEKYFTVAGLDLPGETQVASDELGKYVKLGTVGSGQAVPPTLTEDRTRPALLAICLLLLAVLVTVFIARRMHRGSKAQR